LIPGGTTGGTYLVWLRISGGRGPFVWSVASGELPEGLELLPSGLLRGNPSTPGRYSFGLRVDDSQGDAAGGVFELSFVDPLFINTEFISDTTVGSLVDIRLQGSGGLLPYKWGVSEGKLPTGIDFNTDGNFSGVPLKAENSEITVVLTDSSDLSIEKTFLLNIVENLVLTTQSIPVAVNGESYFFELGASGGSKPYVWSLSAGSLPEGIVLSPNGQLNGVPTVVSNSQISLKVTDSAGRSASFPYIFGVSLGQERQTIVARGGSIVIDMIGNTITYIENTPNEGFTGYLISAGPEKVQFHFIGDDNQIPSWILCELSNEALCSFD
jgi:hypothetical protein